MPGYVFVLFYDDDRVPTFNKWWVKYQIDFKKPLILQRVQRSHTHTTTTRRTCRTQHQQKQNRKDTLCAYYIYPIVIFNNYIHTWCQGMCGTVWLFSPTWFVLGLSPPVASLFLFDLLPFFQRTCFRGLPPLFGPLQLDLFRLFLVKHTMPRFGVLGGQIFGQTQHTH